MAAEEESEPFEHDLVPAQLDPLLYQTVQYAQVGLGQGNAEPLLDHLKPHAYSPSMDYPLSILY